MKKFIAMAVMSLAAAQAMAGVKLVVRSDYVNTPNYDDTAAAEVSGTSLFKPEVARLYLSGNVGEATFDAGLNLRQFVVSGGQKVMTVDNFVEHLTISKAMDNWTFTAGKMWMNVGGYERRAFYDGDTYFTSLANGGVGGKALLANPTGATGSVVTPENMSGVAAAYKINDDHKIEAQLANQTNHDSDLTTATNKRHTIGLAYWGSFADKMVMPYLSYVSGAADTTTANHEQTFIAAGFRFNVMENLTFDLEYLSNKDKNTTASTENETTSTLVEARYKMGMWVPVVKYEMGKDKVGGNDNFDRNAFAVALEIVPKAEDAFRYHVAYTSATDKYDAGGDDVKFNTLVVGFKYVGDVAK